MQFLAIDPGSVKVGLAVFIDDRLVHYEACDFEKIAYERRLLALWDKLEEIQRLHPLDEVAIEAATRRKSRSGNVTKIPELEVACRFIKKWAKTHRLGFREHNASTWRKGFTGHGNAPKDATARVVYLLWPRLPADLPDHVTDAIGVGVYHYGVRRLEILAGES